MNAFTASAFEWWLAQVVQISLNEDLVPDDYPWDLNDCEDWRQMHRKGMTAFEAVEATFRPGYYQ